MDNIQLFKALLEEDATKEQRLRKENPILQDLWGEVKAARKNLAEAKHKYDTAKGLIK